MYFEILGLAIIKTNPENDGVFKSLLKEAEKTEKTNLCSCFMGFGQNLDRTFTEP